MGGFPHIITYRLIDEIFGIALPILYSLILEDAFSESLLKTENFQKSVKSVGITTIGQG